MNTTRHNWKEIVILCIILLLGLALRCYNLSFPAIGYHNMKENDYLSMAQEMKRTNDYISRRIYFWNAFEEPPEMKVYPQVPLITYHILISWRLLDENIWGPRLFNVIFGVLSILVIYFISFLLFGNTVLSLGCAFLLAIMPLAVFFSRNLQPESPAFFFMLLGNLFYLRFTSSLKKYNLFLGGLSFSFAWLYKLSFLIGIFPFIFCFPFMTLYKARKGFLKYAASFSLPFLVIVATIVWLKYIGQWEFQDIGRVNIWEVFSPGYWQKYSRQIWFYIKTENFTLIYTLLTVSGIIIAFFRRKGLLNRYLIGWVLAIIVYSMLFSDYINQHNYYQMPFLVMVCISCVYAFSYISEMIKKFLNKDFLIYIMIVVVGISGPFVYNSTKRMFGVAFLGVDVAGESLREFTKPDERIFLYTYPQGYAIARYGRRYVGWISDFEDFKQREERFNIRYVCFYPAKYVHILKADNPRLFDYIQNNYHLKEVGLTQEPSELFYLILEKGKGSDPENFLKSFSGQMQLRNIYKIFGRYIFFYALRPLPEVEEKK